MVWKSLCFWTIFKVFSTERSQNIYIHTDTNNIKYEGKNQQQIERKSAFAERRTLQMRFDVALNFVTTFLSPYCCVQLQLIQIYDKWRKKNYLFCFICSLLAVCFFFTLCFSVDCCCDILLFFKKFCVWFLRTRNIVFIHLHNALFFIQFDRCCVVCTFFSLCIASHSLCDIHHC